MTDAEKIRELELENARLRGANEALEKICAAYRGAPAAPTPAWPCGPGINTPLAPPVVQPTFVPTTNPFNPLGGHGGGCACPQCVPPTICGEPMPSRLVANLAAEGRIPIDAAPPVYMPAVTAMTDLVIGGPQRPGWDLVYGGHS